MQKNALSKYEHYYDQPEPIPEIEMDPIEKFKINSIKVFGSLIGEQLNSGLPDFKKFKYLDDAKDYGRNRRSSMFLWGPPGTGKTFTAALACIHSFKNGRYKNYGQVRETRTRLITFSTFLMELKTLLKKDRYDLTDPSTGLNPYTKKLHEVQNCSHLILDDLGAESITEYSRDILFAIVDYRYLENMRIIVTSNYSPNDLIKKGYGREISRIVNMVSRNNGSFIELTKDLRNESNTIKMNFKRR